MTPLFQKSVLKGELRNLKNAPKLKAEIEAAWERFTDYFHNPKRQEHIRKTNEEQFQEGFLDALFVKVLGYTRNPNPDYNLTTELKNPQDGKKADGAILNPKNGKPLGVIELKDYKTTDLTRVENQAFGYHSSHPTSRYIVISNFEKLRFYIDKRNAYEEFNLFTLKQERFEVLWFCLSHYALTRHLPQQAQEISVTNEEEVTKRLYADYANFRDALFDDLRHHNPEHDALTLFKKAQKLLDRIIFMLFAEDRLLIPPNTSQKVIREWIELVQQFRLKGMTLYERLQHYFTRLNKGSERDFPAYNGGLFAPDAFLDQLRVSDEVLQTHIHELARYDYQSEVSVNILGHIFEHSISEIEEIQEEIETSDPSAKSKTVAEEVKPSATPPRFADGSKNRRKRDGVFYTPAYITRYIIESTLGRMCEEKKRDLGILDLQGFENLTGLEAKNLAGLFQEYRDWLLSLTICDPACGSGAFLVQALDFLLEEHRYLDELEAKHAPKPEAPQTFDLMNQPAPEEKTEPIENQILRRNLYGVDINPESVEIAKLSLWIHTAKRGQKLTFLSDNLKSGNSLIDDPEVAGTQAFNWQEEFPHIFEKGGFDVVVGNPPYVVSRSLQEAHKKYFYETYTSAVYQINLYLLFMEKSLALLKNTATAVTSMIVPNAWLVNRTLSDFRQNLIENYRIMQVTDLTQVNIFDDATVLPVVYSIGKGQTASVEIFGYENEKFFKKNTLALKHLIRDNYLINYQNHVHFNPILDKIDTGSPLGELAVVSFGVKFYQKGKGTPAQTAEQVKTKVFNHSEAKGKNPKKVLEGKDIDRYLTQWRGQWVEYGEWLAEPRSPELFEGERVLLRRIVNERFTATFVEGDYCNNSLLHTVKVSEPSLSTKFLLTVLNSRLMGIYFIRKFAREEKTFPEIRVSEVRMLPICLPKDQKPFITLANRMLDLHASQQDQIDRFLRRVGDNLLRRDVPGNVSGSKKDVSRNVSTGVKFSKKMQQFYLHDFQTFLSELKKKKVKLSLAQQDEWEPYFEESKAAIVAQQAEIDQTDREIDALVYQLYGLTEEEIKIVEGAE